MDLSGIKKNVSNEEDLSSLSLTKKDKSKNLSEEEDEEMTFSEMESLTGGGREDDLFGVANDYTDRNAREFNSTDSDQAELYRTKIPWDLKFAYSLTYANNRRQNDFSNKVFIVFYVITMF